jgi:5-methylthioribose kinase
LDGRVDLTVAEALGRRLRSWHDATRSMPEVLRRFDDTSFFEQLRVDPFFRTCLIRHPDLTSQIQGVIESVLGTKQCLVHGDFSPKNVLTGDTGTWVLDWEVAHTGNPRFDLAFLLTHLLAKSVNRPPDAAAHRAATARFLAGYGDADERSSDLIATVGCLLLARIDGKSPAPYLGVAERDTARRVARRILLSPPRDIDAIWNLLR